MLRKLNRLWYAGLQKAIKGQAKRVRAAVKKASAAARPAVPKKPAPRKSAPKKPGRGKAPSAGTWTSGYFRPSGGIRGLHYRLYLPPGMEDETGLPLVVMMHGCEQDAERFAAGTRMDSLAAARSYALLYPEQSPVAHPRRCWKWYDAATQRGAGDAAVIAQLVEDMAASHPIDRGRIYVCGISAGAAMAHILALNYPELIAAVGLHSGPVFGACRGAAAAIRVMQQGVHQPEMAMTGVLQKHARTVPMPAIVVSGASDPVVRPINLRQLERQFLALNRQWPLKAQPPAQKAFGRASRTGRKRAMHIRDHLLGRKLILRTVEIEGLGHAWSGGDDSIAFHAKGPDANRMMLDFYARHRGVVAR